jgi:hypothetical protein
MAASIREAVGADTLYNGGSNTTGFSPEVSTAPQLSLLELLSNNKVPILLAVFAIFVLGQIFKPVKRPAGSKPLPMQTSLPWAGRFWDVPEEGIAAAWHFGQLHKKLVCLKYCTSYNCRVY